MADEKTKKTEAEQHVEEIELEDATRQKPRGNVHSEPDQPAPHEAPAPLPH